MRVRWPRLLASVLLSLMALSLVLTNAVPPAHPDSEVTTIPLGSPPADVAVNPITDMVYAVNGHGIVSVINGSSDTVTGTLTVTNGTFSIAVNPKTNLVYVGNLSYNLITVINGTDNKVVTTIQNVDGEEITVNPNTNTIFTLGSIINGSTDTLIADVKTDCGDAGATTIAVNTATDMAYVAAAFSVAAPTPAEFCLTEINGATGAVVNSLKYDQETTPGPLSIDTNTNTVYEGQEGPNGDTVYTINGTTDTQTGSFTGQNSSTPVAFDQQRNLLYVTGTGLDIYNAYTDTVIQSLSLRHCGGGVAVNTATDYLYMTDYADDSICVIQGTWVASPGTNSSSTPSSDTTSTSSSNPSASTTSTSVSTASSSLSTASSLSATSSATISSSSSSAVRSQSTASFSSTSTLTPSSSTISDNLTSATSTSGYSSPASSTSTMSSLSAAASVIPAMVLAIVIVFASASLRLRNR